MLINFYRPKSSLLFQTNAKFMLSNIFAPPECAYLMPTSGDEDQQPLKREEVYMQINV